MLIEADILFLVQVVFLEDYPRWPSCVKSQNAKTDAVELSEWFFLARSSPHTYFLSGNRGFQKPAPCLGISNSAHNRLSGTISSVVDA